MTLHERRKIEKKKAVERKKRMHGRRREDVHAARSSPAVMNDLHDVLLLEMFGLRIMQA